MEHTGEQEPNFNMKVGGEAVLIRRRGGKEQSLTLKGNSIAVIFQGPKLRKCLREQQRRDAKPRSPPTDSLGSKMETGSVGRSGSWVQKQNLGQKLA